MGDLTNAKLARLQAVMTELLRRQIGDSLALVEGALGRWRGGELNTFEAHAELLRHAARAERLAARMARVGLDNAAALLRDAFDAGLLDKAEFVDLLGRDPDAVSPSPSIEDELGVEDKPQLPPKREVVDQLLGQGAVLLHVDSRRAGVAVPDRHRDNAKLILRIGYQLSPPIPDLCVDDDGVAGSLTFSGSPFGCVLPWSAVYAVVSEVDHRGMVWPDDVPAELLGELKKGEEEARSGDKDKDKDKESAAGDGDAAQPPKRGGHLKLVD